MKKGEGNDFLTPVENLDNIKRVLAGKYKRIEFPDYKEELDDDEEDSPIVSKKRTRGPNKPKAIILKEELEVPTQLFG